MKAERVLERAGDVRDEVRLARGEVDEAQVVGLERRDLAPGRAAITNSTAAVTAARNAGAIRRRETGEKESREAPSRRLPVFRPGTS